ncbi:hypothetical protein V6N13_065713 [Hibiscus sabdariffa]
MLSQENVIGKLPTPRVYEEPGSQPPDGNPILPLPPLLERPPSPTPLEGENGSKRMDVVVVPKQSDASTGVVDATYASKVRSNVQSRRRTPFSSGRRTPAMEGDKMQAQGSRFGVLNTGPIVAEDTTAPSLGIGAVVGAENNGKALVTAPVTFSDSMVNQWEMEKQSDGKGSGTQSAAYLASNPDKKKKGIKKGVHSVEVIPTVVNSDPKVVQHLSNVQSGSHAAIQIVEKVQDGLKVRHVGNNESSNSGSGGSVPVRRGLRFKKSGLVGKEILEEDQWARMSADMEEFDGGTSQ